MPLRGCLVFLDGYGLFDTCRNTFHAENTVLHLDRNRLKGFLGAPLESVTYASLSSLISKMSGAMVTQTLFPIHSFWGTFVFLVSYQPQNGLCVHLKVNPKNLRVFAGVFQYVTCFWQDELFQDKFHCLRRAGDAEDGFSLICDASQGSSHDGC